MKGAEQLGLNTPGARSWLYGGSLKEAVVEKLQNGLAFIASTYWNLCPRQEVLSISTNCLKSLILPAQNQSRNWTNQGEHRIFPLNFPNFFKTYRPFPQFNIIICAFLLLSSIWSPPFWIPLQQIICWPWTILKNIHKVTSGHKIKKARLGTVLILNELGHGTGRSQDQMQGCNV